MKREIENAIRNFSPKHYGELAEAARNAGPVMADVAGALGAKCRELRLMDFPNPYLGTDDAEAWRAAFDPKGDDAEKTEVAVPAFAGMSKQEIEKVVKDATGVDLDRRFLKAKMVEEAEKVWAEHFGA